METGLEVDGAPYANGDELAGLGVGHGGGGYLRVFHEGFGAEQTYGTAYGGAGQHIPRVVLLAVDSPPGHVAGKGVGRYSEFPALSSPTPHL